MDASSVLIFGSFNAHAVKRGNQFKGQADEASTLR